MVSPQKITTNLWFNSNAEEAVNFYTSIFKDSGIGRKTFYGEEGREFHGKAAGTVMTIDFFIEGRQFIALNAGDEFKFNESISFIINCADQNEVDYYWNKLSESGQEQMCGWLKDKFGLSWQVVPTLLTELLAAGSPEQIARATAKMFQMRKIDIATIQHAVNEQ